eukprot:XP_001706509.1 Hypothetical protein GL50803_87175 [Giardia lamblia ATCC 50803]
MRVDYPMRATPGTTKDHKTTTICGSSIYICGSNSTKRPAQLVTSTLEPYHLQCIPTQGIAPKVNMIIMP